MATNTVAKTNSSSMAIEQRVQPNQSLYIQNLPEKLQKPDLKRSLYMLFSTFGPVLDVTAVKSSKMRGQAHVLFRDVHAATQAMRACQGFEFYGREMVSRMSRSIYGTETMY
jgi:U2 small nuclear ribonucleoprotein B''